MRGNGQYCLTRRSNEDRMRIAIIIYGHGKVNTSRAVSWGKKAGDPQPLIINNHVESLAPGELEGDNRHYEFSAYRMACRLLDGEGPFVVVNDTLFHNHWAYSWVHMLRKIRISGPAVVGDIRTEKISFPEKSKSFLASWVFYMPDRNSLTMFSDALDSAFERASNPVGTDYNEYIDRWLKEKKWYGGWHGSLSNEAYQRKKSVIRLEHALSLELEERQLMKSIALFSPEYKFVRLAERLYTRLLGLLNRVTDK
jgi:hypothetical protein